MTWRRRGCAPFWSVCTGIERERFPVRRDGPAVRLHTSPGVRAARVPSRRCRAEVAMTVAPVLRFHWRKAGSRLPAGRSFSPPGSCRKTVSTIEISVSTLEKTVGTFVKTEVPAVFSAISTHKKTGSPLPPESAAPFSYRHRHNNFSTNSYSHTLVDESDAKLRRMQHPCNTHV